MLAAVRVGNVRGASRFPSVITCSGKKPVKYVSLLFQMVREGRQNVSVLILYS
jgi:hypothetical protein